MVDERSSPSKGWIETSAIMERGAVSELEETILFNMAQAGDAPSYESYGDRQSTLDEYREKYDL